jgi:hypothetical protein
MVDQLNESPFYLPGLLDGSSGQCRFGTENWRGFCGKGLLLYAKEQPAGFRTTNREKIGVSQHQS